MTQKLGDGEITAVRATVVAKDSSEVITRNEDGTSSNVPCAVPVKPGREGIVVKHGDFELFVAKPTMDDFWDDPRSRRNY